MTAKTYFISDCHLGAHYIDDPRNHEQRVVRFLDAIKDDASQLFLLGDIIDYWYEYHDVVPRGHVRFFGKLAQLADSGVEIFWLTGNHDVWLFDYLRDEIGIKVLKKSTVVEIDGKKVFISHGDDVGRQPPAYRFMRTLFYNRLCQTLYASLHPRITTPIANFWSKNNRVNRDPELTRKKALGQSDLIIDFARGHHQSHPDTDFYVFGHLHLARTAEVDDRAKAIFLGDWITQDTFAVMQDGQITLKAFKP